MVKKREDYDDDLSDMEVSSTLGPDDVVCPAIHIEPIRRCIEHPSEIDYTCLTEMIRTADSRNLPAGQFECRLT